MSFVLDQLIPRPHRCEPGEGFFILNENTRITAPQEANAAAELLRSALNKMLLTPISPSAISKPQAKDGDIVFVTDETAAAESYRLRITPDQMIISGDPAGMFYAVQTLRQMMLVDIVHIFPQQNYQLPCCELEDAPRFQWRGFMLDSARHFQSVDTVKNLIDKLAIYKINRLHWHLNDIFAWRIPIPQYPELLEQEERLFYDKGFYTPDDIREVVSYARDHFIEVIPEIEMPSHSSLVFKSRPDLACPNPDPYGNNIYEYCIGNPAVKTFLREILTEARNLFPDAVYCHIGGDEARHEIWEKCPVCNAAVHDGGLSGIAELEDEFMRSMADFATSLGFRPVVWAGCKRYSPDTILQGWRKENLAEAIESGHPVINSIHNYTYFDYPGDDSEDKFDWMPPLPVEKVYSFDPVPPDTPPEAAARIIGAEACLWTEKVPENKLFNKVFPRLCALAEVLWDKNAKQPYPKFRKRMKIHMNSILLYREHSDPTVLSNINDVAREAKVSKTTVSLFMNGKALASKLSTETCARIATTIRQHNYRPNIHARTILTKRNFQVSLLLPVSMDHALMLKIAAGISGFLEKSNYRTTLQFIDAPAGSELRAPGQIAQGEDGCIWFSAPREDQGGFTVPMLHVLSPRKSFAGCVQADYSGSGVLAANLLRRGNCRTLGILSFDETLYGAVRISLQQQLAESGGKWIMSEDLQSLLAAECDAIYFDGNRALCQLAAIPDFLQSHPVLGTASLEVASLQPTRFSVIDFDWETVGQEAARMLLESLDEETPLPESPVIVGAGIRNYGKGGFLFEL